MNGRFPIFVLTLLLGLGLCVYGAFGHTQRVFDKPDPRDDPEKLLDKNSAVIGELTLTNWIAKERVVLDEWGHLIDKKTEAPCES